MSDPKAKITISLVDKTKKGFKSISKSLGGLRKGLNSTATAVIALAGPAALGFLAKSAIDAGREIRIMSQIANASASEFQKLAFGAQSVGIENEKFADILKDVNDKIGDFQQAGSGAYGRLLRKYRAENWRYC